MEGLGGAASVMAVLSLAIQLIDSIRKIRRFLRSVSDAPKELKRIFDLLEQLESILEQITMLIEKQQTTGLGETDIAKNVLRAIKKCESKLCGLESLIERIMQELSTSSIASRTIGSLKLACKKNDIQDFENQLHDVVNLLSLTMMVNLTYIHSESMGQLQSQISTTNQTANAIMQEMALIRVGFASDHKSNYDKTIKDVMGSSQRNVSSPKSMFGWKDSTTSEKYTSFFGQLIVQRKSRSANVSNDEVSSTSENYSVIESSWVFIPSVLSTCIDFRCLSTCGSIQRSVRTYPVIPSDHHVWIMCRSGDLQGVQKLLSERRISPFSVDQDGETLLHFAALYYMSNICKLLFEMGLTGEERDHYGRPPYGFGGILVHSKRSLQNFKATYHLFNLRVDGLNPASFGATTLCGWLSVDISGHVFKELVYDFVSKENIKNFGNSPILTGMWKLWQSQPTDHDHDSWKAATRHLISLVTDHHHYKAHWSDSGGLSLLGQILNIVDRSFESISIGRTFLDILSELNFDVVEYLRVEFELHFDRSKSLPMLPTSWHTEYRERYLVISESPPSVSWDWYIEPEGSAFDIINEFKNCNYWRKFLVKIGGEEMPFDFAASYLVPWDLGWRPLVDGEILELEPIHNARLQRRQDKKAWKLAKAQGVRRQVRKMPGAWIE